jgi:hypothetical protein
MPRKILTFIISFIIISAPSFVFSAGLIPDCGKVINGKMVTCGFNDFMKLINNIINFLLFYIASPLAAVAIAYAGFLYLSSGGSSDNISKAKKILGNVFFGYIIALAAWLIVNTIFASLGVENSFLRK